ncbi:GspH/FimT family pseudopilin [Lysobacter yangpyeongensis]|uniref:Type II secretion system protein H n=1 Tax=Lysobacter yangpyeongensis TaxID=346182 RepID=A0ABW0SL53_9GAMM
MQKSQGFTLIELMVTVAVLAVLLTLASPSFSDFFQRYRLRGAADKVVNTLASARAEAVMRNRDVSIDFKGSAGSWCMGANAAPDPATLGELVGSADACDCTVANSCKVADGRELVVTTSQVEGVTLSANPGALLFSSRTGATSPVGTTATTTLASPNGKFKLRLDVSALGRATLCVPSGEPAMAGFKSC